MTAPEPSQKPTDVPGILPPVPLDRPPAEAVEVLEAAAKRGRLAGFHRGGAGPAGPLFTVSDFGGPFEAVLEARPVTPTAGPSQLLFSLRLKTALAWVYLAVLLATVWPGVWLTDSMLRTYFTNYHYKTWMWYLPLTAPFVPWAMWTALRRSRTRAREEAGPIISSIAALLAPGAAAQAPRP